MQEKEKRKRFYKELGRKLNTKREKKNLRGVESFCAWKEIEEKQRGRDFTRSADERKRERKIFYEELGMKLKITKFKTKLK